MKWVECTTFRFVVHTDSAVSYRASLSAGLFSLWWGQWWGQTQRKPSDVIKIDAKKEACSLGKPEQEIGLNTTKKVSTSKGKWSTGVGAVWDVELSLANILRMVQLMPLEGKEMFGELSIPSPMLFSITVCQVIRHIRPSWWHAIAWIQTV